MPLTRRAYLKREHPQPKRPRGWPTYRWALLAVAAWCWLPFVIAAWWLMSAADGKGITGFYIEIVDAIILRVDASLPASVRIVSINITAWILLATFAVVSTMAVACPDALVRALRQALVLVRKWRQSANSKN